MIGMETHHGVPLLLWTRTKEEIRAILSEVARNQQLISYSELVGRIKTITLGPDARALHEMLGEISVEEDTGNRGMLSVVVVHKQGDKKPGAGFFKLAAELGRDLSDTDICWINELQLVYRVYRRKAK